MVSWRSLRGGYKDDGGDPNHRLGRLREGGGALKEGDSSRITKGKSTFDPGKMGEKTEESLTPEGRTGEGGTVTRTKKPVEGLKKVPGKTDSYYTETPTAKGGKIRQYYQWDPRTQTLTRGREGTGAVVPVTEQQRQKLPLLERYAGTVRSSREALMVGEGEAYVYPEELMDYYAEKARKRGPSPDLRLKYLETGEPITEETEITWDPEGGMAMLEAREQEKENLAEQWRRYTEQQRAEGEIARIFQGDDDWQKVAFAVSTGVLSWSDPFGAASGMAVLGAGLTGGDPVRAFKEVKAQSLVEMERARGDWGKIAFQAATSPMSYAIAIPKASILVGKLPLGIAGAPAKFLMSGAKGLTYGYMGGELGVSLQGAVAYKQEQARIRSFADLGRKYGAFGPSLNLMLAADAKSVSKFLTEKINIEIKSVQVKAKAIGLEQEQETFRLLENSKVQPDMKVYKTGTAQTYEIYGRSQANTLIKYETRVGNLLRQGPKYTWIKGEAVAFKTDALTLEEMRWLERSEFKTQIGLKYGPKGSRLDVREIRFDIEAGTSRYSSYNLPSDIKYSASFKEPWRTLDIPYKTPFKSMQPNYDIYTSLKQDVGKVLTFAKDSGSIGNLKTQEFAAMGDIRVPEYPGLSANVKLKLMTITQPTGTGGFTWKNAPAVSHKGFGQLMKEIYGGGQVTVQRQVASTAQISASSQATEQATKGALAGLQRTISGLTQALAPRLSFLPAASVAGMQRGGTKGGTLYGTKPIKVPIVTPGTKGGQLYITDVRDDRKFSGAAVPKPRQATKIKFRQDNEQIYVPVLKQGSASAVESAVRQDSVPVAVQKQVEKIIPVITPNIRIPAMPVPSSPQKGFVPIPPIPMIGLGTSGERKGKKKKKRRGMRRAYRYTPTLGAVVLGLTTPKTPKKKGYSGLEIRPVVGKIGKLLR